MTDLTHIKVGDRIAIPRSSRSWGHRYAPRISNHVLVVEKLTATQIVCMDGNHEHRIRRKDGFVVGGNSFNRATEATSEIIAAHNAEVAASNRYHKAAKRCDAIYAELTQRTMHIDVMEAIADAYEKATAP